MPDTNKAEKVLQNAGLAFSYEAGSEVWVHLGDDEFLGPSVSNGMRHAGYQFRAARPRDWGTDIMFEPRGNQAFDLGGGL